MPDLLHRVDAALARASAVELCPCGCGFPLASPPTREELLALLREAHTALLVVDSTGWRRGMKDAASIAGSATLPDDHPWGRDSLYALDAFGFGKKRAEEAIRAAFRHTVGETL